MSSFDDVMEKIGFSGYGDHTGVGKTIFLSLLFMGFTTLFVYFFINELLTGNPAVYSGFNAYITLGVSVVVAFFAVFWRHKILIILYCLISVICIFNIVHIIGIEKNKAYPAVVRELFGATEENLKKREMLYAERLARTVNLDSKTLNIETEIPQGGIITIIQSPDNDMYRVKFRYKGEEATIGTSVYTFLRLDRTYKLSKAANLYAGDSASSEIIKEIPKRQKVILTGDSSADASMIEVLYNNEKGWIASDNLFGQIAEIKMNPFTVFNVSIIVAAFVLLFFINYLRALAANKKLKINMHKYYETKRIEYPWLDNWLKTNEEPTINPVSSAFSDLFAKLLINMAVFALIAFALGFLINLVIIGAGFYGSGEEKLIPAPLLVLSIIGLIVSHVVFNSGIRSPEYINHNECKKCKCPESVLTVIYENIVDEQRKETEKVTTTRKDSTGTDVSSYTNSKIYYVGREIITYGCQNCKGTYKETNPLEWKWTTWLDYDRPDDVHNVYYKLGESGEWEKV